MRRAQNVGAICLRNAIRAAHEDPLPRGLIVVIGLFWQRWAVRNVGMYMCGCVVVDLIAIIHCAIVPTNLRFSLYTAVKGYGDKYKGWREQEMGWPLDP